MWLCILSMFLLTQPGTIFTEAGTGFKFDFDYAIFKESDNLLRMELYFRVPFSALVFEQQDSAFVGRYLVTALLKDERNEPWADKNWEKAVKVTEYDQSQNSEGIDITRFDFNFKVPNQKKMNASIKIEDLNSTRQQTITFAVNLPNRLSGLRLSKSGKLNPRRIYGESDTVEVYWEIYSATKENDSCWLALLQENKVLGNFLFVPNQLKGEGKNRIAEYQGRIPLGTFSELESGVYKIRVKDNKTKEEKMAEINVTTPFYLSTKSYLEKVDELRYIATDEEIKNLRKAAPSERQKLWQEFWQKKDPTPTTPENETMEDYFKRIEYCKEHFGRGDRGYKSDRAQVYMKYGPPDQTESNPFDRSTQPYEIWYYYNLNLRFVFVDASGFGEYILTSNLESIR